MSDETTAPLWVTEKKFNEARRLCARLHAEYEAAKLETERLARMLQAQREKEEHHAPQ